MSFFCHQKTNKNTIPFIDQDHTKFTILGARWGLNGGVIGSPGFFVRNGRTQSWTNITTPFTNTTNITASYSYALSPTYYNNYIIRKQLVYQEIQEKHLIRTSLV